MKEDPIISELFPEDKHLDYTEACRAIAEIVQAVKGETGAEKVSVTIRISPDGTNVTVDPWEPLESDAVALLKALAGKVVEIREKGADGDGPA